MELASYVRMDCVQRGSYCSMLQRTGTSLLRSYGLCSAQFALFIVFAKLNYLVECARTVFSAVRIVQCRNKVELACYGRTNCV